MADTSDKAPFSPGARPLSPRVVTRQACDNCRIRKRKCSFASDEGIRWATIPYSQCTFLLPSKARGPKTRRNLHHNAAQHSVSPENSLNLDSELVNQLSPFTTESSPSTGITAYATDILFPRELVRFILSDYVTYVYPLIPVIHQPTFQLDFDSDRDMHDVDFLALIISLCAVTVSLLPSRFKTYRNFSSPLPFETRTEMADQCYKLNQSFRDTTYFDTVSHQKWASTFLLGVAFHQTVNNNLWRMLEVESMQLLRLLEVQHLSSYSDLDAVEIQLRKKAFWLMFYGYVHQMYNLRNERLMFLDPATLSDLDIEGLMPNAVDDEFISCTGVLPCPEDVSSKSLTAGFNIHSRVFAAAVISPHLTTHPAPDLCHPKDPVSRLDSLKNRLHHLKYMLDTIVPAYRPWLPRYHNRDPEGGTDVVYKVRDVAVSLLACPDDPTKQRTQRANEFLREFSSLLSVLDRPTMDNVLGPAGDWSIQAGSQACLIFRKSQLYCCWATPPEYRTQSYYSPDVSDALRACSNILALLSDLWPKAECLRGVFELLAREVPLVDRPNRPPTRISDASASVIKEKLPQLRSLILNRSVIRMITEMATNDFPRIRGDQTPHHLVSRWPTPAPAGPVRERSAPIGMNPQPLHLWFDLPFSAQPVYGEGEVGDNSTLKPEKLFAFSGQAWSQLSRASGVRDSPRSIQSFHTQDETMYLVDLYFRFIHDSPHSLFHEPTFKASVAEGTVSKPVLLAMLGLSASSDSRFATESGIVARGPMYRAQATAALKEDLEHICIENIQACILVGNNFFGLASRMTQILKLGEIEEGDDGVMREVKRRIFWTCFIIDTWASGGSNLSPQFRWRTKQPRGPLDEYMFYSMRSGDGDVADLDWKPGLWAHMVRLVGLYAEIQNLQQELANGVEWNESFIDESVQRLEAELGAFEEGLGPDLMFSRENLIPFVRRGLGRVFIAFHLGYHHYYTLLFYQYLDHRRPPTRNGRKYASSCKAHAAIVCDVLKASREVPGAEALYNIVGHVTIVSSSVLLHTYLFGESHELEESRDRLSSNLESLVQLRNYWPSVEMMIKRLVVFQKNCIQSMNAESYRFDRWMVKFLIAHALALEDKVDDSWSAASVDATNGDAHLERGRITQAMIMDLQNYDTET
ncbi:hypothetical protein FGLOB1_9478 [Fusarium globosum]|uniref:Transcription factor domain-containing protein n=1 Tax=Fusarium globosum TaxID=78864 RepID=A0A8H5XZE7_9HYPO|nr:hypothetical protein FGLOB1_9478 [Fusarium globosum]